MPILPPKNKAHPPDSRSKTVWCSVIIPTLNEVEHLPRTLNALGKNWPGGRPEIIVADGGSTDGTPEIAQQFGAILLRTQPGRARQLNAGAARATGQWLYFLHADTLPPDNLALHLRTAALNDFPASFAIRFDGQAHSHWLRLFARLSQVNISAFRFGDQSLFVSRKDFASAGGYREDYFLMEGYELAYRLRKLTKGFRLLPGHVTTSSRRYLTYGVLYTQLVYGLIFSLYQLGVGQKKLLQIYQRAFRNGDYAGTKVGTARKSPSGVHSKRR